MRLVSIPVNKEVVSIDIGDFNGDGKPDLVYYGTPAEVEILYNEGAGRFGERQADQHRRCRREPGSPGRRRPGSGRSRRLALLAENELILVFQTAPGVLSEPERVPHTASNPRLLKLAGPGRQRSARPGDSRQRDRSSDSRSVRDRREEAGTGAAIPGRGAASDRLRPDRRSRRTGDPDHREPVRPVQGPDARRVSSPTSRTSGAGSSSSAYPPGAIGAGRWPSATSTATSDRCRRHRSGERSALALPAGRSLGLERGTVLSRAAGRAKRSPGGPRPRRQRRGLRRSPSRRSRSAAACWRPAA